MDEILGLPAHPLLVHGAVVLVPLAATGVALIAFWPAARFRLGYAVLAIAAAGAMTAVLAQRSGESLEDRVADSDLIDEHTDLGATGTTAGLAVFVAALGVVGTDVAVRRRASRVGAEGTPAGSRATSIVVGVVALVLATGGAVQVARIGHSGAKAVWNATTNDRDDEDNSGPGNSEDRDD